MLQFAAHADVQSVASGDPCIISESGIRVFTRKLRHYECGATGTAAQPVVYGHHCIISNSREEGITGEGSHRECSALEPLSNRHTKAIYKSSPIFANDVSLNKGSNRDFTSTGIMTRRTSRLGRRPGKKKSCKQKNVSQTSATTGTFEVDHQKIEVEQKCVARGKLCDNTSI